jgi:hypothetical protein
MKNQKKEPKPDLDWLKKVTDQINKGRSDRKKHQKL